MKEKKEIPHIIPPVFRELTTEQLQLLVNSGDDSAFAVARGILVKLIEVIKINAINEELDEKADAKFDFFNRGRKKGEYNAYLFVASFPKFAEAEIENRGLARKNEEVDKE